MGHAIGCGKGTLIISQRRDGGKPADPASWQAVETAAGTGAFAPPGRRTVLWLTDNTPIACVGESADGWLANSRVSARAVHDFPTRLVADNHAESAIR